MNIVRSRDEAYLENILRLGMRRRRHAGQPCISSDLVRSVVNEKTRSRSEGVDVDDIVM